MSAESSLAPPSPLRRTSVRARAAAAPVAVGGAPALSDTHAVPTPAPTAGASRVQRRLVAEGFLAARHATGTYDAPTGAALARWQAARGLHAHGLVDSVTADTLLGTGSMISHRRTTA